MRAIVTGANGFVGSNLIKKLVENNINVLAIDISFANSKLPQSTLIEKLEMSIDEIDRLTNDNKYMNYDLFYHFAWIGVNGPEKGKIENQLKNIDMTIKCAKVAKELSVKKFLCAGTVAERNIECLSNLSATGAGMFYGAAKHAAHLMLETYCKNIGLDFVWMQFSNIYGPSNKTGNLISYTLNQLNNNEEATFGPAKQPYDFIFVDDLINAIYLLGINKTNHNFYFIGSGKPMILSEYLNKVGKICNKEHLIKIGVRSDDGIKYSFDMFDNKELINDIGNYVSMEFEEAIRYTIENY